MTKAEELAQKLMSGDTQDTAAVEDANKGRKRAAKDWIQHYIAVTKFIKELDTKPSTQVELEALLIASWETKASERDDEFATLMGAA